MADPRQRLLLILVLIASDGPIAPTRACAESLPALISELKSGTEQERLAAVNELGSGRVPDAWLAIPELSELQQADNAELRDATNTVLARLRDEVPSIDDLIERMIDVDRMTSQRIGEVLAT